MTPKKTKGAAVPKPNTFKVKSEKMASFNEVSEDFLVSYNGRSDEFLVGCNLLVVDDRGADWTALTMEDYGAKAVPVETLGEALTFLKNNDEDICILLDLNLNGWIDESGIEVLKFIVEKRIPAKCIVFSAYLDKEYFVMELAKYGVAAIVPKTLEGSKILVPVIKKVHIEGRYVCDEHNSDSIKLSEDKARHSLNIAKIRLREQIAILAKDTTKENVANEIRLIIKLIEQIDQNIIELGDHKNRSSAWRMMLRFFRVFGESAADAVISEATKAAIRNALGG